MRRAAIILAALGAGAVVAPAAHAATTVGLDGNGGLVVAAGPERNSVLLYEHPLEDGRIVVSDSAAIASVSAGCADTDYGAVECYWNPAAGARVTLGEGDDRGSVSGGLPTDAPIAFAGEAGNDDLQASYDGQPTTLDGGPGDDLLLGNQGPDVLLGGDGNDSLEGKDGQDRVLAGAGDDTLSGDGSKGKHADVIDGGPGTDKVDFDWSDGAYDAVVEPVAITLAGGADDGRPGEGDDVRGVETIVTGNPGRMIGTDAAEHLEVFQVTQPGDLAGGGGNDLLKGSLGPDKVDGGGGDDSIDAGYGDDVVTGGPGRDDIAADRRGGACGPVFCDLPFGNDTVDARDGERDSIMCGVGQDSVQADPIDVVSPDCETVSRDGSAPGPGGEAGALGVTVHRAKLAKALARGLKVTVNAPAPGRIAGTAKVKGKRVAAGSRRVAQAGPAIVVLRFTAKARRRLRRARRVPLQVTMRFGATRQQVAVALKR
jgi:RTX calcium-binding nonapeptide repeat (4 copies)